jgi:hypothetical protein
MIAVTTVTLSCMVDATLDEPVEKEPAPEDNPVDEASHPPLEAPLPPAPPSEDV